LAVIVILGAGMMGTALAWPFVDRGHVVRLVGTHLDGEIVTSLRDRRLHPKLHLDVPDAVEPYFVDELPRALEGADAVALGVSSAGVRWAGQRLAPLLRPGTPVAMVSKGLEWDGSALRILPDVFASELPEALRATIHPVGIAGPCIAGELARRVPTAIVFTARSSEAVRTWSALAAGPYYHVFPNDDVVGVEVCAALKNAYAMGIALATGMHAATGGTAGSIGFHNLEAALFAQSVLEMRAILRLLGGDPDTANGLAGVGDLDVTCNGGRTGRFGHLLGLGLGPDEAVRRMQGATLECLEILRTLRVALTSYVASGRLLEGALPLAEHLARVALDGAPVDPPLARFFGEALGARSP